VKTRLAAAVVSGTCWLVACASSTTDTRIAGGIYWKAAKACEPRYRTLHLDRIDSDGNASMHADADSRMELPVFIGWMPSGRCARGRRTATAGRTPGSGYAQPGALGGHRLIDQISLGVRLARVCAESRPRAHPGRSMKGCDARSAARIVVAPRESGLRTPG